MNSLLTLPLRAKRDTLIARHRARQIAALLHFSPDDQACIAAGAFAIAAEAIRLPESRELCVQIENHALHVFARVTPLANGGPGGAVPVATMSGGVKRISFFPGQRSLRLIKPLPVETPDIADNDLSWIAAQLSEHPVSLFDEVRNQNQEVLALLHALHECRAELDRVRNNRIAA